MASPKVSIIVRSKNEERWISHCLKAVYSQSFKDFEVILVDNHSDDRTVERARQFGVKVVQVDDYLPGKAINVGVDAARGEYVALLSAHCVPTNERWLQNLVKNLDADTQGEFAGVYGRQEPLSFTNDLDKRDLLITFGLDRKVQVKDSFFHNANSLVRKSVLEKVPFDGEVTNIEDRLWAKAVISAGYKLVYEPEASVFHWHGIHQGANLKRARSIVQILQSPHLDFELAPAKILEGEARNIVAIIAAKGKPEQFAGRPLIEWTIEAAKKSKLLKRVIVSTDHEETREIALKCGAEVPFLRPQSLSAANVGVESVLQHALQEIESKGDMPDVVVYLSITQPFRPRGLIDDLIRLFCEGGFDSVIPGFPTFKSAWMEQDDGEMKRMDAGFLPSASKKPMHIGYPGLACVTYPEFVRKGKMLGKGVGILEVLDYLSTMELKGKLDRSLAEKLYLQWSGGA